MQSNIPLIPISKLVFGINQSDYNFVLLTRSIIGMRNLLFLSEKIILYKYK